MKLKQTNNKRVLFILDCVTKTENKNRRSNNSNSNKNEN